MLFSTDVPPVSQITVPTRSTPKKYYAVIGGKDGFNGVVNSWECASLYTSGLSNAIVKKYATVEEAADAVSIAMSGRATVGRLEYLAAQTAATASASQGSGSSGTGPM